jgi:hypothetical protein
MLGKASQSVVAFGMEWERGSSWGGQTQVTWEGLGRLVEDEEIS